MENAILCPLQSEKSIRLMEAQNKLLFAVKKKATKEQIKRSVEETFKVKVTNVNTFVNPQGQKRAYVQLSKEIRALDIATQLGMM